MLALALLIVSTRHSTMKFGQMVNYEVLRDSI